MEIVLSLLGGGGGGGVLYLWRGAGEELNYMGGVIFITAISLFHFFRKSQHPEK